MVDRPLSATGPAGLLAARTARRNTARASSTATALIIGVGLVAFVATLTGSIAASTPDGVDPQARLALTTFSLMLVVAVFISAIGVANTLGLSILERIRETGLLRAVGALRAQIRGSIRSERSF